MLYNDSMPALSVRECAAAANAKGGNMIVEKTRAPRLKGYFARFTKFGWAALALVLAFLVVGACTIGGFSSPGKSYFAAEDSSVVFYLDYQAREGESSPSPLDRVYLNVGAMYAPVGSDVEFEFRRATASGSYSSGKFISSGMGKVSVGNVWSAGGEGISGANYNWVKVFDFTASDTTVSTSYKLIQITFPCDMLVNEVIFVDEAGEVIPAYVHENDVRSFFQDNWAGYRELFSSDSRRADAVNLVDGQNLVLGRTTFTNFTQDEMYTLMQIDDILAGDRVTEGTFNADTDNGPLAVLFPLVGTLLFGKSQFGLRIFSVLFSAALVAVAYFLGKELFGKGGFGFLFACLFAAGGLALTVGRLGLSLPVMALFAALSFLFMYRFFVRGVDGAHPVRSASNVLLSGVMFAFAFAADPKCAFLLIGLVALFVAGAVRFVRAHASARRALDARALEAGEGELAASHAEERAALHADYVYGSKLIYLFFFISFVVATALVTVLASLPSYATYVRLYDPDPSAPSVGIFSLLSAALGDAFRLDNVTQYTLANTSSSFGWLIALKGATLFSASGEGTYIALNAQPNLAVTVTALVGFAFMTVYAILYLASGGQKGAYASKHAPRILCAYFLLAAGLLSSVLQFAFTDACAANGLLFNFFYFGFAPLMFYTAWVHDGSAPVKVLGIRMNSTAKVLAGFCAVYIVLFALSLPMYFGIPVAPGAARALFGWTTFINNGFYRA